MAQLHCLGKTSRHYRPVGKEGDLLYVEGRVEYSSTEKDGVKRYWTDINVQELSMLGKDLSKPKSKPEESKRPEGNTDPSDDLPF